MKFIRDAIYGYIPLTRLEIAFLGHPSILRLHRVIQNSTLFLTYPNNRGTRFAHSIGSMHIAGLMFKSLMHNSEPEYIREIHNAVVGFLEFIHESGYLQESRKYLCNIQDSHSEVDHFFRTLGWHMGGDNTENDGNTINNILLQAIRLAALAHDIGHPPYSHTVESALSDWTKIHDADIALTPSEHRGEIQKQAQSLFQIYTKILFRGYPKLSAPRSDWEFNPHLHEQAGVVLMNDLYENRRLSDAAELSTDFWRASFQVSLQILTVAQFGHYLEGHFKYFWSRPKDYSELIKWYPLGQIISGPVDCDRLDYLRRDAYNSGAPELASFDQDRIINNLTFAPPKFPHEGSSDHLFLSPAFDRRTLSALNDFFSSRARQYRWLVNHHNVVKTDLALARLILDLAQVWESDISPTMAAFLQQNEIWRVWTWDNIGTDFRYNDDSWLDTLLQRLYLLFSQEKVQPDHPTVKECQLLLEVLLDRSVDRLIPLWKREDDFEIFANGFMSFMHSRDGQKSIHSLKENPEWEGFAEEFEKLSKTTNPDHYTRATNKLLANWVKLCGRGPYTATLGIERRLSINHQVNVMCAVKVPSKINSVLVVLQDGHGQPRIEFLDRVSPTVRRLKDQADRTIESLVLYCYIVDGPGKKPATLDLNEFGRIFAMEFLEEHRHYLLSKYSS